MKIKPIDIAEKDMEDLVTELYLYLNTETSIMPHQIPEIMDRVKKIIVSTKEFVFSAMSDMNSEKDLAQHGKQ